MMTGLIPGDSPDGASPARGFPGRSCGPARPRSEGGHGTIRIATGSQPIIFPCR